MDQSTLLNENSGRFGISIAQRALVRQLESFLGTHLTEPLRFVPSVDHGSTAGYSLQSLVQLAVNDLSREESGFEHPLVATQFEQLLFSALLSHQPHNYRERMPRPSPAPAPRDVRRALDYIHSNLDKPVTMSELVEITGVPGRSLYAHFRRFTGKSPVAYAAGQRLACVRRDLLDSGADVTVTTIATRWGFTQLGRFAGVYRRTYGESPGDTLKSVQLH